MRVLLVTDVYPTPRRPNKGTFNRELVNGLRQAGDEVRVVAPVPWTDLVVRATSPREAGVEYPLWFHPPRLGHARQHRWMRRSVLPVIANVAGEFRPDVVLAYWTHPDGTVALEAARRLRIPGVLLVGGSDIRVLTRDAARCRVIVGHAAGGGPGPRRRRTAAPADHRAGNRSRVPSPPWRAASTRHASTPRPRPKPVRVSGCRQIGASRSGSAGWNR